MSNKTKAEKNAKKNQYGSTFKEKAYEKLKEHNEHYNNKTKYKERIKTSYICIVLYFLMATVISNQVTGANAASASLEQKLAIVIAGAVCCIGIAIFNIVKHALSIRDNKSRNHNIVLICVQVLVAIMITIYFFNIPIS